MRKIIVLLLFGLFMFSGCGEEFLERPPFATLSGGTFPATAEDAELAVNGVYNSLRNWNINTGGFPLLDIMSDQQTKGSNPGDGATTQPFEDFTFDATDPAIERWWGACYQAIRRANIAINGINALETMDPNRKNLRLAELRFLRGYFYSILVRGMGDVVLTLENEPPLDLSNVPAQQVLEEVILPDLQFAADNLPEKSDYSEADLGRATRGAAKALLARIHLYYGNFDEVERLTLEVINSAQYGLENSFEDAFSVNNENGIESVWEIGALPVGFGFGGNQYGNTQAVRGTPNRGWGFGRPAYPWIVMMQNNNDPRLEPSVIFLGEVMPDGAVTAGDGVTPDTTYNEQGDIVEIEVYNQKIWHPGTNPQTSFGHNRRMIRYSDVLLMAAEALNENDNPNDALIYLNRVRERARGGNTGVLPDITTTDKDQLRQLIWDERNYELAFEGLRFWDLVRTDQALNVLGPLGFTPNKNELLPIPQIEIDISEGRITQNPGYE